MKNSQRLLLLLLAMLCSVPINSSAATATCRADGVTDSILCLQSALNLAQARGESQLFLQKGTYLVSRTLIVPNKVQLIGTGRGDPNWTGTVLLASNSFPLHSTVVEMGTPGLSNFGVQVKNLTINGGNRADFGLQNIYSMELSYGEDLLITNFLKAGLDVEGYTAQNSGPFRNLEIYPGSGPTVTNETNCIIVRKVIAFRGIDGVTCNAGTNYLTRPEVALQVDSDGSYSSFHIEHFATAVRLGSEVNSADGVIFMNGQFGPDVDTGILIDSVTPDQNISIFGVSCSSCQKVLTDQVTANSTRWTVGFYLMGNGAGTDKKVLTSDHDIANKLGVYHQ